MRTILTRLGIRPQAVGVATLQRKGDFITAAVERDRLIRSLGVQGPQSIP